MAFVEFLGVSQEDAVEGPLWRETLGRSLGSHDAAERVGGMVQGNGWNGAGGWLVVFSFVLM